MGNQGQAPSRELPDQVECTANPKLHGFATHSAGDAAMSVRHPENSGELSGDRGADARKNTPGFQNASCRYRFRRSLPVSGW